MLGNWSIATSEREQSGARTKDHKNFIFTTIHWTSLLLLVNFCMGLCSCNGTPVDLCTLGTGSYEGTDGYIGVM